MELNHDIHSYLLAIVPKKHLTILCNDVVSGPMIFARFYRTFGANLVTPPDVTTADRKRKVEIFYMIWSKLSAEKKTMKYFYDSLHGNLTLARNRLFSEENIKTWQEIHKNASVNLCASLSTEVLNISYIAGEKHNELWTFFSEKFSSFPQIKLVNVTETMRKTRRSPLESCLPFHNQRFRMSETKKQILEADYIIMDVSDGLIEDHIGDEQKAISKILKKEYYTRGGNVNVFPIIYFPDEDGLNSVLKSAVNRVYRDINSNRRLEFLYQSKIFALPHELSKIYYTLVYKSPVCYMPIQENN